LGFTDAKVQIFRYNRGNSVDPHVELVDDWDVMICPHGDPDKDEQLRRLTAELHAMKSPRNYKIRVVFSEKKPNIYFATCNYLQYVFMRTYETPRHGETLDRILIPSFPTALSFDYITNNLIVGLDDGWIMTFTEEGKE